MKKSTKEEIIKKWEASGLLDGLTGLVKDKDDMFNSLEPDLMKKVYATTKPNNEDNKNKK